MSKKKMRKKKSIYNSVIAVSAIASATGAAIIASKKLQKKTYLKKSVRRDDNSERHAYFVGGGLASLAGAAYLIRDCGFLGENIHILEGTKNLGGSNDAAGNVDTGFICPGGRMLNEETYENFWELFGTIPSLTLKGKSVKDEILNFDHLHPTHANARLIDKNGKILDVSRMGFNNKDRIALAKLMITPEDKLDDITIEEWFHDTPHFFQTNFWYLWQTTFTFQKWSSLSELRRYIKRMIHELPRIDTLEGVTRTPFNQYESVILPLKTYLDYFNVDFSIRAAVTDIDFKDGKDLIASTIHMNDNGNMNTIQLSDNDLCIVTNGCMTDNTTLGDLNTAPTYQTLKPMSAELWGKISKKREGLGNPEPFFGNANETNWESFTITCKGNQFLKLIEEYSMNSSGSGAFMTFKDSNWLLSIVIAAQPHFKNQPLDTTILWGYGLYTDKDGNYVKKAMKYCTGKEILTELLHHLHLEDQLDELMSTVVNVIPCMMPYVVAQFQPHKKSDRPFVVPKGSKNFAMISQFVEIPNDMVFTEEYSVRAARMAVYTLLDKNDKKICPVTPYSKNPKVIFTALKTAFR